MKKSQNPVPTNFGISDALPIEEGFFIEFENPQSATAEGQFAAWYLEDELVGSGVIS